MDAAPYYPYQKIINDWYNYRMELKAKGSKLEQPFKIILNSIYGKTAQRVNEKIGNMFNPIIATTITGKARSMLYDFIIKNRIEDDVIMMYTDSVTCKKNLNLSSKKLGDFSLDFEGSIYTIQSGFYSKNGVWKSRGFGQIGDDTISSRAPTVDHKGRIIYEFERTHVGTIKQNILRNEIQNIGKFSMQKRKMNPNADRGRFWLGRLTDARKTETNYSSPFMLPVFDPSKI